MAEYSGYKDVTSSRHLRFKLQSLGRRLDELEEATKSLQKAEDELLDLQDKVIQAEGSNSGMLAEVEALRKRVLKIEGKDEEIKKAEDMCQLMKEKLEEQENLTQDLKAEIERLQKRMAELEELEEAFGRSKNDCTQLCLRLNEERNLTKKISSELETLRVKVKELETSEDRLGKTEQSLAAELEKLRSLTLSFVSERKYLNDRDRENEKLIKELTQKLEQNKVNLVDHPRNASTLLDRNDLRIEDGVSSTLPSKEARRKGMLDYRKQGENETRNKSENEKNRNQEDNKVKDLNQEIEKLKTQIKHYESLEEELKKMRAQNNDLKDSYQSEQNKNKLLASQLEEVKLQLKNQKDLENGEVESEESFLTSKGRQHERPKYRGLVHESPTTKNKSRELSPQHKRGERARNKEHILSNDNTSQGGRQVGCSGSGNRRASKASSTMVGMDNTSQDVAKRPEDSFVAGSSLNEGKRVREQPSVLSRYPPAAQEHRILKGASKPGHENGLKGKVEKTSRVFNDASHGRGSDDRSSRMDTSTGNKVLRVNRAAALDASLEVVSAKKILNSSSGSQVSSGLAAELGTSKAMDPSVSSRRSSSEGLSKCKRSANDQEADSSPPTLKPPVVSKTSYGSKSQEEVLPGFVAVSKGEQEPVSVMTEDSGHHEALRCRVIKPSGRERLDLEDDMDTDSLVTAKLVNTTITPESESKRQPRSRAALRTPLFDHDRDIGADPDPVKPGRNTATEFQDANNSGVKNRRPFSPREALRSKAVIKPIIIDKDLKEVMGGVGADSVSEKPKPPTSRSVPNKVTSCITIYPERHTSTSNIQVVPSETPSVTNHISLPFEISINKNEITRQITDADQAGDPPLKNRPETVVSRSSITIKPSEPSERNSQESPSENLRWKSHRSPLEMEPSDTKHVTVRSAWRTRRDLNSLEDPPSQGGKNVDLPNAYMQRSSTDFSELERPRPSLLEQGGRRGAGNPGDASESSSRRTQSSLTVSEVLTRRGRAGDSVSAAALSRPAGLEEAEGSNLNSFRWQHNCLERPELPAKRPPELTRVRAEERVRRVKHSSEEN